MVPSAVQKELSGLTEVEEMLIAHALPLFMFISNQEDKEASQGIL